jgi:hypothetical protein
MKVKTQTIKKLIAIVLLCFIHIPLWAQEFFEDDTIDEQLPVADIDDSLVILLITGISLGYVLLYRKIKKI